MNTQSVAVQETTQYPASLGEGEPAGGTISLPAQPGGAVQRLKSERVQEELKAMAGWSLGAEGVEIMCEKTFPTPEAAALYAAFVAQFAAAAGFSVTLDLAGGQVGVTVWGPQIYGCWGELTESVLGFAKQLG